MEYHEFICAVEKKMNFMLKGGVKASQYTVVKNNGKAKRGLVIETPGINISPTIYLEEFYQRFQKGESLDEITQNILDFYYGIKCEESWNTDGIEQYSQIRDKIVFQLIHTEKNKALLESVPHMKLLDLSIVFYALLDVSQQGTATMTVNNGHLQYWNVGEDELFADACENVARLLPAQLLTMRQMTEEILHPLPDKRKNLLEGNGMDEEEDFMYVLSNPIRSLGAACIAYPRILERAGEILKENYYVLPSSIHEVILVPESKGMKAEEMDEMVAEINATQVAEDEILSDHVYFYERLTKKLVIKSSGLSYCLT